MATTFASFCLSRQEQLLSHRLCALLLLLCRPSHADCCHGNAPQLLYALLQPE